MIWNFGVWIKITGFQSQESEVGPSDSHWYKVEKGSKKKLFRLNNSAGFDFGNVLEEIYKNVC